MSFGLVTLGYLVEGMGLFAVWNWRLRSRSVVWAIGGGLVLLALVALAIVMVGPDRRPFVFGMMGTYLAAALLWTWRFEGLVPDEWRLSERFIASVAAALLVASYAAI
ncbi:hypothetical protein ACFSGX_15530 [Sphingomonas arantia]|uniref:YnfA family protein n=1 Tax=Sphingomonas arantia TaxID=1460676 RepID=A0ABW4TZL4_9SPHN